MVVNRSTYFRSVDAVHATWAAALSGAGLSAAATHCCAVPAAWAAAGVRYYAAGVPAASGVRNRLGSQVHPQQTRVRSVAPPSENTALDVTLASKYRPAQQPAHQPETPRHNTPAALIPLVSRWSFYTHCEICGGSFGMASLRTISSDAASHNLRQSRRLEFVNRSKRLKAPPGGRLSKHR